MRMVGKATIKGRCATLLVATHYFREVKEVHEGRIIKNTVIGAIRIMRHVTALGQIVLGWTHEPIARQTLQHTRDLCPLMAVPDQNINGWGSRGGSMWIQ